MTRALLQHVKAMRNIFLIALRGVALTFAVCVQMPSGMPQSTPAGSGCISPKIPADIQTYLKTEFPLWRVKQPADLRDLRADWEWFKHRSCPGIAVGRFEPGPNLAYAFLLVPRSPGGHGFKLVVVTRGTGSGIKSKVLAFPRSEGGEWVDDDWFIRNAKLNWYFPHT